MSESETNIKLLTISNSVENTHTVNDTETPATNKATTIMTIFSIWNCMIGCGTVAVPFVVRESGIIPYITFNLIFFLIGFYTCNIINETGGDGDYSEAVKVYFGAKYGNFGKILQILFCLAINIGAGYIYFLIMK
jgi:amino acid permease